jgi:hypothetical protein
VFLWRPEYPIAINQCNYKYIFIEESSFMVAGEIKHSRDIDILPPVCAVGLSE